MQVAQNVPTMFFKNRKNPGNADAAKIVTVHKKKHLLTIAEAYAIIVSSEQFFRFNKIASSEYTYNRTG